MTRAQNRTASILAILFLLACWWWQSWNFNDPFVAGEYVSKSNGICNNVRLNKDHTFAQELWHGDRSAQSAEGTWRRFGEGGIAFSKSFLGASPQAVTSDNVYGMLDNTLGYHTLTIDPQDSPIRFHKRFLTITAACSW